MSTSPRQRLLKSRLVERLEQKVECVDLEGLECMVIMRGDEHDRRRLRTVARWCLRIAAFERFDDVEAVDLGHLDVEEHQVGILVIDSA